MPESEWQTRKKRIDARLRTLIAKADCFCIRPFSTRVDASFLAYQLASHTSYRVLAGEVHGATRPRVNLRQVKALRIRICPLEEQLEIVRRVDALFQQADAVEKRSTTGKAAVDNLTQSILAKAFRGELVPRDPADEPASVLLERIRKKRNTETGSKQRNRRQPNRAKRS